MSDFISAIARERQYEIGEYLELLGELSQECQRKGQLSRKTKELAGLERYEDKMQGELNTLARNSAVDLGGDTVVPIGSPEGRRQVFEIYRCMR